MARYRLRKASNNSTKSDEEADNGAQLASKTAFFHYMLKTYSEDLENKAKKRKQPPHENHEDCSNRLLYYFKKWIRDVDHDLTVFVYGIGSKHTLIQSFKQYTLETTQYNVLVLNGHNYSEVYYFDILRQLNAIYRVLDDDCFVDEIKVSSKKFLDTMNKFFDNLKSLSTKSSKRKISKTLLIFDNINYIPNAPNENIFDLLLGKLLSQKSLFCLLATYNDQYFISTISYQSVLCSLQLVHYQINTLENFWREIVATNYLEKNFDMEVALDWKGEKDSGKNEKIIESVLCVYPSLTRNAQQIFNYIIKTAMSSLEASEPASISHAQLYEYCRRNFLTTNESSLRSQLVEFIDHNLIDSVTGDCGDRCYELKIRKSVLSLLLEKINKLRV